MRQIAGSFSTAVAAIVLQDRQFANTTQVTSTLGAETARATQWLDGVQAGFAAQGLAPGPAHTAALSQLSRLIDQQAQLLACEDVYRMLALVALAVAAAVLVQRRLK